MTTPPMYVSQPPLRWLRLALLVATLGLSCVCVAAGAQALDKQVPLDMTYLNLSNCDIARP